MGYIFWICEEFKGIFINFNRKICFDIILLDIRESLRKELYSHIELKLYID